MLSIRRASLTTLALASLLAPAGAEAAGVRECGRLSSEYAFNITSRNVSCAEAKRVVRGWGGRGNVRVRGLSCRYRDLAHELGDIRCTGTRGRVVRWQTGV